MRQIAFMLLVMISVKAWEINTHRAIDRKAVGTSINFKKFVQNSNISTNKTFYDNEQFEGYNKTYINYVEKGETNGISTSKWKQDFTNINLPSYQKMVEAGAILEDAQWPHYFGGAYNYYDKVDGRFVNHFYDAQSSRLGLHGLTMLGIHFDPAHLWGFSTVDFRGRSNNYDYLSALDYFEQAFTHKSPTVRRKYQAKMLVSVGHLLHLMNDMSSPAHTRDDAHGEGDVMEVWGSGEQGFNIVKNSSENYAGIDEKRADNMLKYNTFSEFITKEATWTSTHFFSKDTIFTKPKPSISDTYEEFVSNKDGMEKYYIKSYGDSKNRYRDGSVKRGTKLGIRVKSYTINVLRDKYYTGDSKKILLDKSTSFQGDYSVIKENAKVLIPRAISNARNFLNYFFRGQLSAKIDGKNITITNISDPTLVTDKSAVTFKAAGAYHLKYHTGDGVLKDFVFERDLERYEPNIVDIGQNFENLYTGGFQSLVELEPGDSIVVAIKRDASIIFKHIIVIYDGLIGNRRGISVSGVETSDYIKDIAH